MTRHSPRAAPRSAASPSVVLLSHHPVSDGFAAKVGALCGPVTGFYDAAHLGRMSPARAWRDLRRVHADTVVIAIESEPARALVGPLAIAALCMRARSRVIVWPRGHVEQLPRVRAVHTAVRVLCDTLSARRALARCERARSHLERATAPPAAPGAGAGVLYLDLNIARGPAIGGAAAHTAGVLDGLLDRGFSVDYASQKPLPTQRDGAHWLPLEPQTLAVPLELNYYPYAEAVERQLLELHASRRWAFIYQRLSVHNCSGVSLGRKLALPVVVEFNGSEVWAAEHWSTPLALAAPARRAEHAGLTRADLVVAVSDPLVMELRRRGIGDDRILVYPNCVDPRRFDPRRFPAAEVQATRKRYGIAADAFVVGFIGTFGRWHGIEFLAARIRDLVGAERAWMDCHRLHFLLVGDGTEMPVVRQALAQPPFSRYVTLTGLVPQHEGPRHLACANLLVAPHVPTPDGSEFFGSPTKLFEYMAMERPILAAALGQMADVMTGRGATTLGALPAGGGRPCGMTFEPGNAEAFRDGLRRLVDDPALAAGLARAAREEVLARYTWDRHVGAILQRMAELRLLAPR